jgi:hypothetical protein
LANLDHVFFEYQPRHTSAAVCEMFAGDDGYLQADAHAVCSSEKLVMVLDCLEPAIEPNCDEAAFFECANASGCIDNG